MLSEIFPETDDFQEFLKTPQLRLARKAGVRNGPTVVPLELSSHTVARTTSVLAYRIAPGAAQCPGRQWEKQLHASHRRPPARSTLEWIAKKI
ncbi:MAG: hypothetical protein JXR76_05620 [Deltaproteobacteria bacterium]|nr:hypothetical protein [Deltaproteobacteria bacterium]